MLAPLGGMLTPLGVSGIAANVLASVPWVAQWKFNNTGNDSIGSNNLTNNNSATFTTGKLGGATGATQLVAASTQFWSVLDNAALSLGSDTPFLLCGWVYPTFNNNAQILGKTTSNGSNTAYSLIAVSGNKLRFRVGNNTTSGTVDTGNAYTLNGWNFFVAWYDNILQSINIKMNNGTTASASWTGGTFDDSNPVQIGRVDGVGYLTGNIDDLCFAKGSGAVPTQAVLDALWNNGNGTETLT